MVKPRPTGWMLIMFLFGGLTSEVLVFLFSQLCKVCLLGVEGCVRALIIVFQSLPLSPSSCPPPICLCLSVGRIARLSASYSPHPGMPLYISRELVRLLPSLSLPIKQTPPPTLERPPLAHVFLWTLFERLRVPNYFSPRLLWPNNMYVAPLPSVLWVTTYHSQLRFQIGLTTDSVRSSTYCGGGVSIT